MDKILESLKKDFQERLTMEDGVLFIHNANTRHRYVITTALSFGRAELNKEDEAILYNMPWTKTIVLGESLQKALHSGLDNLLCDLGSVLQSVEDGTYNEDDEPYRETLAEGRIIAMQHLAQVMFDTIVQLWKDLQA